MKDCVRVKSPYDCCGCGACASVCAGGAITMREDAMGFAFPSVDEARCVRCGRCAEVCVFTERQKGANGEPDVFAAALNDCEVLLESSSGGAFTALANVVLEQGGAVFGAAWTDELTVAHICVETKADLWRLRGSKYVQSVTGDAFRQARELLQAGRTVCYSGTPCQIAGLKSYIGGEFENLLTVDVICHGVPSMKMLRDDLAYVSGRRPEEIEAVSFRDKAYGWGVKGSLTCGGVKHKYNAGTSPYYFYYLKGEIYRESCYRCRFPGEGRQGDITLGDYWGVRHELLDQMEGVDPDAGISCLLVNTEKGRRWLYDAAEQLTVTPSDRAAAEKRNGQLTAASELLPEHEALLGDYLAHGYAAFRNGYKKHTKDHVIQIMKNMIPSGLKRKINDTLR